MSYFSDVFRLRKSNALILSGCALLIAALAGAILRYEQSYYSPPLASTSKTAPIHLLGRDGTVTFTCQCPSYLVVQQQRSNVRFDASIQLNPARTTIASLPGQLYLGLYAETKTAMGKTKYDTSFFISDADLLSKLAASQSIHVTLEPQDAGTCDVSFYLTHNRSSDGASVQEFATVDFQLPVRPRFSQVLKPVVYAVMIFVAALVLLYSVERKYRLMQEQDEQRFQAAQARVEANPDKASPSWELAGANLEKYFARNLSQVRQVFYVSVGVMLAGFSFVLYAVYEQVTWQATWLAWHPDAAPTMSPPAWIAAISGLITQFIGATFMVIYRSTMAQANEFVTVLDRINTVGIAMKVLDQIDESDQRKNSAREQLISLLLSKSIKPSTPTRDKKHLS